MTEKTELYVPFVTPLLHANTGFIHISWWELDEVIRCKEEELNWRTELEDLEHNTALKAIDAWLTEFPEADIIVQESRNGRLLTTEFFSEAAEFPEADIIVQESRNGRLLSTEVFSEAVE